MAITLNEAKDTAKNVMASAKGTTEHAGASTRRILIDGVHLLAGLVPLLRSFQPDGLLARVGLARRKSPLESLGIFTAGLVVGAAAGALFAPMAGEELRASLLRAIKRDARAVQREAQDLLDGAAAEVKEAGTKARENAEEIADRAKGTVKKAEGKLGEGADAVEAAVNHGADAVKNAAHDAKTGLSATGHAEAGKAHRYRGDSPSHRSS